MKKYTKVVNHKKNKEEKTTNLMIYIRKYPKLETKMKK